MYKKLLAFLLVTLAVIAVLQLSGCKEKSESTAVNVKDAATDAVANAEIEQTICPIMGNPIDKDVFAEYNGKKVYFCCAGCIEEFNKDPEKYVKDLPQFK